MALRFAVSADVHACALASWFIFRQRLSCLLEQPCHLRFFSDLDELYSALHNDEIDLIYLDGQHLALLVREKDYLPVACVNNRSNEVVVVVNNESAVRHITDFGTPLSVAATRAPDVQMFGRRLLESAQIRPEDVFVLPELSSVSVAKALVRKEADAGFFLRESFEELSGLVRSQLRPIVSTKINSVCHAFLVRPRYAHLKEVLLEGFASMQAEPARRALLMELGLADLNRMSFEEAEFMIDLIDKLHA